MAIEISYDEAQNAYIVDNEENLFPEIWPVQDLLDLDETRTFDPVFAELIRYVKEHHVSADVYRNASREMYGDVAEIRVPPSASLTEAIERMGVTAPTGIYTTRETENAPEPFPFKTLEGLLSDKPGRNDPLSIVKRESKKL